MTPTTSALPPITETEFQSQLVTLLRSLGWSHSHTRRAIGKGRRWTTPTSAIGWPDLLAVKGRHLVVVEVKSDKGVFGPGQIEWLERFAGLPCALVWVLRPRDPLQRIAEWLQKPEQAPWIYGWPSTRGSGGGVLDTPLSG